MITLKKFVVALGFIFLLFLGIPIRIKTELEEKFEDFLLKYNKTYENDTIYQHRFKAFKNSLDSIEKLNALRSTKTSALYGITRYSDMFEDEFIINHLQEDYNKRRALRSYTESRKKRNALKNIPNKIDWREKGVVTNINNQHSCGACWAFSTIENIESMYAIKTGKLIKLSTQQVIDCAGYNNNGCDGGDMCSLLAWLKNYNVTIQTEQEYPLHLRNEACKANASTKGIRVVDYVCEELVGDEDYLLASIAINGPVTAAINALSWQNYLGGIIQYHCNSNAMLLNHAVQIVGYNLETEIPYYIVRNSWGNDFGDDGYLYIGIGNNLCGIANEVSAVKAV